MPQSNDDIANMLLGIPELTLEEPVPGYPVIKVKTNAAEAKVAKTKVAKAKTAPRRHETTVSVVPPSKAKRASTKQKTAKKPSQRRTAKGG